jgi:hypothetical protein
VTIDDSWSLEQNKGKLQGIFRKQSGCEYNGKAGSEFEIKLKLNPNKIISDPQHWL